MIQRTLHFQSPRWRTPRSQRLRPMGLWLGTLLWLGIYSVLAYRLWLKEIAIRDQLNLLLTAAAVLLGVIVLLGWRAANGDGLRHFKSRALTLEQMYALTPGEFEAYVAERIFARQGYRVRNTRDTKDGGIDILLMDRQGHQAVVQCKRYNHTVGEPVVRDLYGTMINAGATRAYLVSTSGISADARKWALGKPIELIDGKRLEALAKV